MKRPDDKALAYAPLRLTLGMNIFCHGFIRIVEGLGVFVTFYLKEFEGTILPLWLVRPVLTIIPFAEFTIGLLIILGLFSRVAFVAGALLLASLTFGMSTQSNWPVTGIQLSYAVVYFILLFLRRYNTLSLDALIRGHDTR